MGTTMLPGVSPPARKLEWIVWAPPLSVPATLSLIRAEAPPTEDPLILFYFYSTFSFNLAFTPAKMGFLPIKWLASASKQLFNSYEPNFSKSKLRSKLFDCSKSVKFFLKRAF